MFFAKFAYDKLYPNLGAQIGVFDRNPLSKCSYSSIFSRLRRTKIMLYLFVLAIVLRIEINDKTINIL